VSLPGLLVTVFGLGHMRPASGTWGSTPPPAIALGLVWWLGRDGLNATDGWIISGTMVALGVAFSIFCVVWGPWSERRFGRKDPGQVVADEVAGQAIALLALPWRAMTDRDAVIWNLAVAATAFFAFRLFDIIKPPPANRLQALPAGWGILVDDLFAGVYALAATQVIVRLALPGIL
jgi:phosphatidylglycerophosphatase A